MRTGMLVVGALAWMSGLVVACTSGPGGIGAPCETKDDCEGGLICDEHDGQGSCQEVHDHGDDTEAGSTGHPHETDTDHEHDSGSETGHGHDSGSETGHDGDHETGTGDATTTDGPSAACEAFCGCMTANCSEYAAYPHADEAACLEACAGLSDLERTCFAGFCEDAAVEPSAGLKEHWCEHAWGELGTDEC